MRVPFRIEGFYRILENLTGSNMLVKHLLEPYPRPDEEEWNPGPYYADGGMAAAGKRCYAPWIPPSLQELGRLPKWW